jgi:GTP-binding protein
MFPDAAFLTSAHEAHQFVTDSGVEVAFAGRSNAGKSSAINTILNRRNFARTSKSPGRTQLINFFSLASNQRLVDLPGYGYARVARSLREHWRGLLEEYFEARETLKGLFLVVDSRRLLSDFDWQMLDWCDAIDCPVHVLLTKADKLKRQVAAQALAATQKELGKAATVQLFSATTRQGVDEARSRLVDLLAGRSSESVVAAGKQP